MLHDNKRQFQFLAGNCKCLLVYHKNSADYQTTRIVIA